ncbi:MAG: thiol-disulfide oxidoreductase DCC family protein [Deltaproteobacteria bacterium]
MKKNGNIILFDGICKLCNGAVRFIYNRDDHGIFDFIAINSEAGKSTLKEIGMENVANETIILISDNQIYTKSDAIIKILSMLGGWWNSFKIFRYLPKMIRDHLYDLIARNRYSIFGKTDSCFIPPKLK